MQSNAAWRNTDNTNANVAPSSCIRELAYYNDYFVDYLYEEQT